MSAAWPPGAPRASKPTQDAHGTGRICFKKFEKKGGRASCHARKRVNEWSDRKVRLVDGRWREKQGTELVVKDGRDGLGSLAVATQMLVEVHVNDSESHAGTLEHGWKACCSLRW